MYRRTEAHAYVEHIEPHLGHICEDKKKKKVSDNNITSVDANRAIQARYGHCPYQEENR